MGMMGSIFSGPQPGNNPQIITSFGNIGNIGSLLGNLGVRIPPPPPTQTQSQPQTHNHSPPPPPPVQPQMQMNPNIQSQQPAQQPAQQPSRISYAEIGQLNQSINSLNIPIDNVTTQQETLSP